MILRRGVLILGAVAASASCNEPRDRDPPTEQEIHAADSGVASGEIGRHLYLCDDGKHLLVDFKDEGLKLVLRTSPASRPMELTAPAQGLQYVGTSITGAFTGSKFVVQERDGPPRTCRRAAPE